jgi:poly-gamma-glutamate biosynthesis protein PgsC/CapC
MHAYAYDTELVRIAIVLGVVVSMLFYDRYSMTTGGVIVSGYLALFVGRPSQIAATLGISILTTLIVQKQLRPRYMLFGRRLFEAEILTALILQGLWVVFLSLLSPLVPDLTLLYGIGFLLPGIIAHDMGRQGIRTTTWAALACTLIVFGMITLLAAARDILGLPASLGERIYYARGSNYAYPFEWLFGAIIVNVIARIVL